MTLTPHCSCVPHGVSVNLGFTDPGNGLDISLGFKGTSTHQRTEEQLAAMDMFLNVDSGLKKIHSTSSMLSDATTFHSAPSRLSRSDMESSSSTKADPSTVLRNRTESGVLELAAGDTDPRRQPQPEENHYSLIAAMESTPSPQRPTVALWSSEPDIPFASASRPGPSNRSSERSSTSPLPTTSRRSSLSRTNRSSLTTTHTHSFPRRSKPKTPSRGTSFTTARQYNEDPYILHQRARQLFPSTSSPLSPDQHSLLDSTSFPPTHPRRNMQSSSSSYETLGRQVTNEEKPVEVVLPATVIDWTDPKTRKREYEKIDRNTRGWRGLWHKIAPCGLSRSSRTQFYDEKNSDDDAGSVRRYRLDIDDTEKVVVERQDKAQEEEVSVPKVFWSYFGRKHGLHYAGEKADSNSRR